MKFRPLALLPLFLSQFVAAAPPADSLAALPETATFVQDLAERQGFDADRLLAKAISSGAVSVEKAAQMSWQSKLQLIFAPGLSTAREVTSISGRGVGMDVVRANVERIGGSVEVESRPGQGVRLSMKVPLTLTIIPALTVSAGGHHFAIPRSAIDELVRINGTSARIGEIGGAKVVTIRGRRLPVVMLADFLQLESLCADAHSTMVVLKPAGGDRYDLAGKLTLKGRNQPLAATLSFRRDGAQGVFDGSLTIRRADFAIGEGEWADFGTVANEVQVRFHIVANAAKK